MASGDRRSGKARLLPVRIIGSSMVPTLNEGDWILTLYKPSGLSERNLARALGKVVLVRRSADQEVLTVKRLIKVLDTGYWVEGDNSDASTDSRHYLTISREEIVGRALLRYRRGQLSSTRRALHHLLRDYLH